MTAVPVRWLTVFLDFPAASFGAGVAFWREVTGRPPNVRVAVRLDVGGFWDLVVAAVAALG